MNIWIFAEERSGSTAFSHRLSSLINKELYWIDTVKDLSDYNTLKKDQYIFHTHDFNILTKLESEDTFCIRTTRIDRIEQVLSFLIIQKMNKEKRDSASIFWNLKRDDYKNRYEIFTSYAGKVILSKQECIHNYNYFVSKDKIWDSYSKNFKNITVHYENLCESGVEIPQLNIDSINICNDQSSTIKLPTDYKQNYCYNYVMAKKWLQDFENEQGINY